MKRVFITFLAIVLSVVTLTASAGYNDEQFQDYVDSFPGYQEQPYSEQQDPYTPEEQYPSDEQYPQDEYPSEDPQYPTDEQYPEEQEPQYQEEAQQPDPQEAVYKAALAATNGKCNMKKNPHSYACTKWNYDGNDFFPLFKIKGWKAIKGNWFTVTYVNKQTENNGPEFYMKKHPQRSTIPLGVANTETDALVGEMWVKKGAMGWANWRGETLWSVPETFTQLDAYTVEFQAFTGKYAHRFRCRDFNRNNNHHLLCKWEVYFPQDTKWVEKGYIGYLTSEVWDGFINGQH